MKRLVIALALVALCAFVAAPVMAGQNNYGCGLGSLIFKNGIQKDGLISQTLAGTTNMSTFTQFFGITSGTSNCSQFSSIVSNEKIQIFVAENMDSLAVDMARGNGEYLSTLAVLMDVPVTERPVFYGKLKANFSKIYTSEKVTSTEVIVNISNLI